MKNLSGARNLRIWEKFCEICNDIRGWANKLKNFQNLFCTGYSFSLLILYIFWYRELKWSLCIYFFFNVYDIGYLIFHVIRPSRNKNRSKKPYKKYRNQVYSKTMNVDTPANINIALNIPLLLSSAIENYYVFKIL